MRVGIVVLATAILGSAASVAQPFSALIFTKTAGYRHDSIPDGVTMMRDLGERHCFNVEHTEDASNFTPANLARFRVVVFLNTTGDVLDAQQETALEAFVRSGGGFVGIHSAADTEYDWPFYQQLIGAYFQCHPPVLNANLYVDDAAYPATAGLPSPWMRLDEWYNFQTNPRPDVHVLLRIDESSYTGGTMGADHPIAWCDSIDAGRTFYTASGHTSEAYLEPLFRRHILGGLYWAAGFETVPDCMGDLDCDGSVALPDLAILLASFGEQAQGYRQGDLDKDGDVDLADLVALLAAFGSNCA